MDTRLIAVTGATGRVRSRVAQRLAAAGATWRPVVRDARRVPPLAGAQPAAVATYDDAAAMRAALAGVGTLFLVSATEDAGRVRQHQSAADAAVAAGVRRIVYLSFLNAAPDATFTFARDHWHTEQHIRSTGLPFAFLRDSLYLASLPAYTGADGVLRGPAGDGRVSAVSHEDVADVAAAVLLGDGHDGATYDVTGPAAISLYEVTEELSRVTGRTVTYHPETVEEAYASRAKYGAPAFEVAGWVSTYRAIATGELSTVSDTVERLTGHPPQSFAEWLAANPDSYRHLFP